MWPQANLVCYPDRVFAPTTTTRHVYDVAAQHVISGAMEGVNGKWSPFLFYDYHRLPICHHLMTTFSSYFMTWIIATHCFSFFLDTLLKYKNKLISVYRMSRYYDLSSSSIYYCIITILHLGNRQYNPWLCSLVECNNGSWVSLHACIFNS